MAIWRHIYWLHQRPSRRLTRDYRNNCKEGVTFIFWIKKMPIQHLIERMHPHLQQNKTKVRMSCVETSWTTEWLPITMYVCEKSALLLFLHLVTGITKMTIIIMKITKIFYRTFTKHTFHSPGLLVPAHWQILTLRYVATGGFQITVSVRLSI